MIISRLEVIKNFFIGEVVKLLTFLGGRKRAYEYSHLAPIDNAKNGEYAEALSQALQNPKVTNIALTGTYGSGKSSVLRTFERQYHGRNGFKFLNIGLASFENSAPGSKAEDLIEKSLLQQIIFKVKASKLKESNFNRVRIIRWHNSLFFSAFLVVFGITSLFVINPDITYFKNSFFKANYFFQDSNIWMIYLFVFLSLISIIQFALNSLPKLGVSKLGLASAEVIFSDKASDSILNRHLDELIYFFCKTKFNVLIFEDLDRFNNIGIFIKLRELNTLLNNSDEIVERNLKIKFIYALGDDMFKSMDRAKFFDFIIPIIPIVNSSNAGEILKVRVAKVTEKDIPRGYFDEITLFIDDMRLLLNISNEFVIYKSKLKQISGIRLDDLKLLSLIVYKNKSPEDFQLLSNRRGVVAGIFSNKKTVEDEVVKSLNQQISNLQSEVTRIESQGLQSVQELRAVYIFEYVKNIPSLVSIHLNNEIHSLAELTNDELFDEIANSTAITAGVVGSHVARTYPITFKKIEDSVDKDVTYHQREELIKARISGRLSELNAQIDAKGKDVLAIKAFKLSELIKKYPHYDYYNHDDAELKDDDLGLIKYLISNGYIDENYESYTSFFYEGSLSRYDKQFMINVSHNQPTDIEFELDNPAIIVEKLQVQERLNSPAILNLDLFEYLLVEKIKHAQLIDSLSTLVNMGEIGYEFVCQFITHRTQIELFIGEITTLKPTYWQELFDRVLINDPERIDLLAIYLVNASLEALTQGNKEFYFTRLLSNHPRVFELMDSLDAELNERLIEVFKIKFNNLHGCKDAELFDYIYNSDAYEINERNIIYVINIQAKKSKRSANYTSVINSSLINLIAYINSNIDEYVQQVWFDIHNKNESFEAITSLLNNTNILSDNIEVLIKLYPNKIEYLPSIVNNLVKGSLVKANKIAAKWENVLDYFISNNNLLDDAMISFLGRKENYSQLTKRSLHPRVNGAEQLAYEIINCDAFRLDAYRALVKPITIKQDDVSALDITKSKLEELLLAKKISLTRENFTFLNKVIPQQIYILIEQNYAEYLMHSDDYKLDLYDLQMLIQSENIKINQRVDLLKSIELELLAGDVSFINFVSSWYIEHARGKRLDLNLVNLLLKTSGNLSAKIALFNDYSADLKKDSIITFIKSQEKLKKLINRKHVTLLRNDENTNFSHILDKERLVSVWLEDESIRLIPKSILYK